MDKISGILAKSSRPIFNGGDSERPRRPSDPTPDDRQRLDSIRPLTAPFTGMPGEIEGKPTFIRSSLLDVRV